MVGANEYHGDAAGDSFKLLVDRHHETPPPGCGGGVAFIRIVLSELL